LTELLAAAGGHEPEAAPDQEGETGVTQR
jgi:hypothetical protein